MDNQGHEIVEALANLWFAGQLVGCDPAVQDLGVQAYQLLHPDADDE